MSSLREQLISRQQDLKERLRDIEPSSSHPLYSTTEHAGTLRVEAASGDLWILPWHHFIFGIHRAQGDREQLVLTFVAHEVVLGGSNLGVLVPEIAKQRLVLLRAAPGKYLKSLDDEPFLDEVQVRPLDESAATR